MASGDPTVRRQGVGRGHRTLLGLLGLAVSGVFAYLALRGVSFERVGASLASANYWWLVPSMTLVALNVVIRALRWRILFRDTQSVTTIQSLEGLSIGLMLNNVLPGRAGELARVLAVRRTAGLSVFEIGATVIVERILDLVTLATIGVLLWPWLPDVAWVTALAFGCASVIAGFAVLIGALVIFRGRAADLLERILAWLPLVSPERAHTTRLALVAGGTALTKPRRLIQALALGAAVWISNGLVFATLMPAFGLDPFSIAPWVGLVAVSFAITIPAGPATLGVFEAALQAALVACGIGASLALSYAVVLHAVSIVPVLAMGAVASWAVARAAPAVPDA